MLISFSERFTSTILKKRKGLQVTSFRYSVGEVDNFFYLNLLSPKANTNVMSSVLAILLYMLLGITGNLVVRTRDTLDQCIHKPVFVLLRREILGPASRLTTRGRVTPPPTEQFNERFLTHAYA
jgi:hypothetical protein